MFLPEKEISELNKYYKLYNSEIELEILKKFELYYQIIKRTPDNLTGHNSIEDIYLKNFIDSIFFGLYIENKNVDVLDIGTGAGFPGIPIKIIKNFINLYLLDSKLKSINFLNKIIKELELKNIYIIHQDIGKYILGNNNRFDYVISRAFDKLPIVIYYSMILLKIEGIFYGLLSKNMYNRFVYNEKNREDILKLGCEIVVEKEIIYFEYERILLGIKKNKDIRIEKRYLKYLKNKYKSS